MDEREMMKIARGAYERGRFVWSLRRAWVVVPLGLSALLLGASIPAVALLTSVLFLIALIAGWRRADLGRGAVAGAWVGLVPVVLGVSMRMMSGTMTEAECYAFCLSTSFVLGAIAGGVLARLAAKPEHGRRFAAASLVTALIAITSGCLAIGFGSVFGLGAGMLLAGIPVYARFAGLKTSAG